MPTEVDKYYGLCRVGEGPAYMRALSDDLRAYEARTTQAAIAQLVSDRLYRGAHSGFAGPLDQVEN